MELSTIMVTTLCEMSSSFRLEEGKKSCPFPLAQKRVLDKNHWSFSHIFRPFVQKSLSFCNKSVLNSSLFLLQPNLQKIFGEIILEEYNIPAVGLHLE